MKKLKFFFILFGYVLIMTKVNAQPQPVAYWNFNEGVGILANDSLGNADGTVSSESLWSNGHLEGSCLYFTSPEMHVELTNSNFGLTNQVSVMFWIYTKDQDPDVYYETILSRGQYTNPFNFDIVDNYSLDFKFATEGKNCRLHSQTKLLPGMWHYVALTYDGNIASLYVDGVLQEQDDEASGNIRFTEDAPLILGGGESAFNGKFDELRIYNIALTPEQINSVMNYYRDEVPPTNIAFFDGLGTYEHTTQMKWSRSIDNSEENPTYNLYRDGVQILANTLDTSFIDQNLSPLTQYRYEVEAIDRFGNESERNSLNLTTLEVGGSIKPKAAFIVEPSTTVEVGQPVYFDAWDTWDDQPLVAQYINGPEMEFMWEFGDGTEMRGNVKPRKRYGSGPNVLHFYMPPGVFTSKLILEDGDGNRDSTTIQITVTGEAPMPGFELWHAPFNCRIAQYIYVQIPEIITNNANNTLRMTLTSSEGYSSILFERSNLQAEEEVFLQNSDLPAGNYTLMAEIIDESQQRLTYLKETFNKPYDGMPRIGINEHNATCVNGEPVFLIKPWIQNRGDLEEWAGKYINCSRGIGWYPEHNISTWTHYLDFSQENGLWVFGPAVFEGRALINSYRNNNIRNIIDYIQATKDHEALFAWMWADEPNIGGGSYAIPAKVCAAYAYKCRTLDPYHLVWNQMFGFDYIDGHENPKYYAQFGQVAEYDYLHNADFFGGKKHFVHDLSSFDIYPIEFRATSPRLTDNERGPIDHWVSAMDNLISRNYDLIPMSQSIAVSNIGDGNRIYDNGPDPTPTITPSQLKMELWLCITHNIKGINWFQWFEPMTQGNLDVMEEFKTDMDNYKNIILGPKSEVVVTDNANERGNRVDFCVREDNEYIYIFAVRLSEPEDEWDEVHEPETISVQFVLEDINATSVEVLKENRTTTMTNSTFTDNFAREAVHMYKIRKDTEPITESGNRISCRPNPVKNSAQINFDLSKEEDIKIEIISYHGKLLMSKSITNTIIGTNIITLDEHDLKNISPGMYVLRIKSDTINEKIKIVKL